MTDNSTDRVEEARAVLKHWLDETPQYMGDAPKALHYQRNTRALETALAAFSGAGGRRPTRDDIYAAFYAESAVLDEARAGAQVLTIAQFGAAVHRLLATHPGDHPGDAGEGSVAARLWTALDKLFVQAIQSELNDPVHEYGSAVIAEVRSLLEETKAAALSPTSAPAGDGARREAIARIIKGVRFKDRFGNDYRADDERLDHTELDAADRILALSTQATDREKVLEEAARGALGDVLDWYQSDEHEDRPLAEILKDIAADLKHDRNLALMVPKLRLAGANLSVCAQTTGGVAGPDAGLQLAIRDWSDAEAPVRRALAQAPSEAGSTTAASASSREQRA